MAVNLLHDKLCLFIIAALALCLPNYALRPPVAASQRFARSGGAAGLRSDSSLRQIPKDNISQELTSRDASYLKVKSAITLPPDSVIDPVMATDNLSYYQFGAIFRHSAPYIAMYRGSVMVIHVPGAVLFKKKLFQGLMDDISILHLLGIKLVLVVGLREQLDKRLEALQVDSKYHNGMRITDEQLLRILKEESGAARIEIESAFVRGIKGMAGKRGIDVVSGNFFYSAKPLGVREGVDYKFTGEVRKVDVDSFRKRLDCGDVVLLTSLGHSPSGEVFNVPSESLAAECAAKLNAVKIIYFSNGEGMIDTRTGRTIQNLRLGQAQTLLENWGIAKSSYNYVDEDADLSKQDEDSSIDESFNVPLNTFHSETRSLSSTSQQFNSTTDNSVGAAIDAQTVGILYVSTNGSSVQKVESDPKSLTKETRPSDISSFLRLLAR